MLPILRYIRSYSKPEHNWINAFIVLLFSSSSVARGAECSMRRAHGEPRPINPTAPQHCFRVAPLILLYTPPVPDFRQFTAHALCITCIPALAGKRKRVLCVGKTVTYGYYRLTLKTEYRKAHGEQNAARPTWLSLAAQPASSRCASRLKGGKAAIWLILVHMVAVWCDQ